MTTPPPKTPPPELAASLEAANNYFRDHGRTKDLRTPEQHADWLTRAADTVKNTLDPDRVTWLDSPEVKAAREFLHGPDAPADGIVGDGVSGLVAP
jgi:hypothetical protein